jgi:hypothetical protein
MTAAINKLPYVPSRLGDMGLFTKKGIATTSAVIEERLGKLSLVQTAARGTMPNANMAVDRRAKSFLVPHLPINGAVMAEDIQNVRAFGTENENETVVGRVNDKLAELKQNLEVTKEWHRAGCIQGITYDADASTVLYNWFTEFAVNQTQYQVNFAYASGDEIQTNNSVKQYSAQAKRAIQDALGATPFTGLHAMCGSEFYDGLITSPEVAAAYNRFQDGAFLRDQQARVTGGFPYAGIIWEEYRGWLGSTPFFPLNSAVIFPIGVPDLFMEIMAPADFIESANTIGQEFYAKQRIRDFETGIDIHAQANPLMVCTRPASLIKMTFTGYTGS